jgi:hypothetical protein
MDGQPILPGLWDFLEEELLGVVKKSISSGKVMGALNATLIALISKKNDPGAFEDYKHVSLCNFVYKIIIKILTNKLKCIFFEIIEA